MHGQCRSSKAAVAISINSYSQYRGDGFAGCEPRPVPSLIR
jgi:hypothetical protein